jgi:hypothetical protein
LGVSSLDLGRQPRSRPFLCPCVCRDERGPEVAPRPEVVRYWLYAAARVSLSVRPAHYRRATPGASAGSSARGPKPDRRGCIPRLEERYVRLSNSPSRSTCRPNDVGIDRASDFASRPCRGDYPVFDKPQIIALAGQRRDECSSARSLLAPPEGPGSRSDPG